MPAADFTLPCQNLVGQKIDHDRLQFVKELGSGAYGVVYQAKDLTVKSRDHFYAVKCLSNANLDARQKKFQRRELALHQLASSHSSVVSLLKVIETPEIVYVILEYLPGGDLFGLITEQQKYIGNDALISKVFLQICEAVGHCHELGIFHRDLKPENVLCSSNGEDVKIADFGLATSEKYSTDFGCGSSFYMSPETQGGLDVPIAAYYTAPSDIWSLGIILVNLVCCRNPWRQATLDDETFLAFLYDPNFLRTILPVSKECNEILQAVFHPDARERVNVQELRSMVGQVKRWTMGEEELLGATKAAREAGVTSGLPAAVKAKARLQAREKAKEEEKRLRELHHRLVNSPHASPRPALAQITIASAVRSSPKIAQKPSAPTPPSPRPHFAQPAPPCPRPHYATPSSPSLMSSASFEPYPAFTVSPATPRQHYVPSPYPSNSGSRADNERSVNGHSSTSFSDHFSLDSSSFTTNCGSSSSSIAVGLHALADAAAASSPPAPRAISNVLGVPALSSDTSENGSSPVSSAPATPQVYASDAAHLAAASRKDGGGGQGGRVPMEDVLDLELDSLRVVAI